MPAGGQEFEGDTIVFGGDAAYPPFEWDDDGEPRGFNVDLAGAIARAGGVNARFHLGEWPEVLRALESGEVDAVPMFVSERREREFAFTPPFHFVSHGIYARSEHPNVATIDALDGRTVAVEASSYAHEQQAGRSGSEPSLVLTANTVEALDAVAEGRAEFALLAAPTTNFLIAERDLPLRNVGPPLWSRGYASQRFPDQRSQDRPIVRRGDGHEEAGQEHRPIDDRHGA